MTEYSDAVQVIVRDYDGSIRVFNLDNAKVILRYAKHSDQPYAYHPGNIQGSGEFAPAQGDHLELVIATENTITLEGADAD